MSQEVPVDLPWSIADAEGRAALLDFLAEPQELMVAGVRFASHVLDACWPSAEVESRLFAGEQSNISILYGEACVLKLYRRPECGDNPDIEVHRALAAGPAAGRVPRLLGWLTAEWATSDGAVGHADLGLLVEQIPGAVSGWELALESLVSGSDFGAYARSLGQTLREVHAGLAEAFGSEVRSGVPGLLRQRVAEAVAEVPALGSLGAALDSRLAGLADAEVTVQRIHGDFHLGQVLLPRGGAPDAWRVTDFEGEPLKSLPERCTDDSVWRDVAGMLRSIDYAGAYAVRQLAVDPVVAAGWVAGCQRAFVAAYAEPDLSLGEAQFLWAYQIDKAAYECRYELHFRPDWLPIPVAALAALVSNTAALAALLDEGVPCHD